MAHPARCDASADRVVSEQALVHSLHRGRRGGAQLLAQQAPKPLVDPQALGDVALSFERLHQHRVAAFSVWGDIDQAPAAAFRQGDLSSPDAEASPRRAFQGS